MSRDALILGVDFGTDSVRTVVIDATDGKELSSAAALYPRWAKGLYCDPAKNRFRQHPLDYVEALTESVNKAIAGVGKSAGARVVGIGIDTTGSTPGAVDRAGTPLALTKGFATDPDAMFVLWKDHTAVAEAELINRVARTWGGTDFTKYEGGVYSSEWFWSKILHVLRSSVKVRTAAFSWVEHCDWMPALLTGTTDPLAMKRSRCAAGHKAMWHEEWQGLPPEAFLVKVDALLGGLRDRLYRETFTSDAKAGKLTAEWAKRLGLHPGVAVAVGAFDAHMGGVGGQITERTLVKIMGTSTCDMLVAPERAVGGKCVSGICGQVDGSILPGMIGLEAGQSAFGDVYAWFKGLLAWPLVAVLPKAKGLKPAVAGRLAADAEDRLLEVLSAEAAKVDPGDSTVIALDWLNGRRTPIPQGRHRRPHARQYRAEGVPSSRRSYRVRLEGDRRAVPERRRGHCVGDRPRRHREEEPVRDADHRGRARHAHQGGGLRAGLRARGRHVRRGGGGRAPHGGRSTETHGLGLRPGLQARPSPDRILQEGLRPVPRARRLARAAAQEAVKTDGKRVRALREQVCRANLDLVARGLVLETFGNVSGIDRDLGVVAEVPVNA
jgi:L-ribulokinase